jgi:hypothetical protein
MKKYLLIFAILLTGNCFAQKKMVLIEGFQGHQIEVSDSVTAETVREFFHWADRMHIDYETKLTGLKAIQNVSMSSFRNNHFHNGVIYIESYASKYPNAKRAILLYAIGNYYADIEKPVIILDSANEKRYGYRRKYNKDIRTIMNQLPKEIR